MPAEIEFVHLSTAAQVTLPADRLFAGRRDVLLLAVDPGGLDVRWEPGVPGDPASMLFPHAYGPVPVSAVLTVSAYRPGADGYAPPPAPPARADHAGRLRAYADSRAARGLPAPDGVLLAADPTPGEPRDLRVEGALGWCTAGPATTAPAGCDLVGAVAAGDLDRWTAAGFRRVG